MRPRICFLFNAQLHQLLHGITTAAALARQGAAEVTVAAVTQAHLDYARGLVDKAGGAPLRYRLLGPALLRALAARAGTSVPPKLLTLALIALELRGYHAIAVPERTSIALRRLGLRRPCFIHLDHGAGDRAVSADPRIARFDFVLMAGDKQRVRYMRDGLIRADNAAVVGYPKFDAADLARPAGWRPFANDRPTVLYNPHFDCRLGSWQRLGDAVLDAFAADPRYNLVVAPHIRLFDDRARRRAGERMLARWRDCPNIRIDLGSERLIDMSYTATADIYLGDVSSQVYEFIRTPRPCLFLNAHGVRWDGEEDYSHWRLGPVLPDAADLIARIDAAVAGFEAYRGEQERRFAETFSLTARSSSERAADAIAGFLAQAAAGASR